MFNKNSILNKYGPSTQTTEHDPRPGGTNLRAGTASTTPHSETKPAPSPVAASTTAPASETVAAVEDSAGSRLVVGPNVKLKGAEIDDCDILVVEGRVEATMDSRVLRVAEKGAFAGKVGIDIAEIHGHFDGELTARDQLIIHATGRVSGTIRYGKIRVEEGGELSGDIRALSSERDRNGDVIKRRDTSDASGIKPMSHSVN
jgi:cytoskeletal protein CcmA (bactofilin family)